MPGTAIFTVSRGIVRLLPALLLPLAALAADPFRFVIIGDRTGSLLPGVYEQVLKEAAAQKPAFIVSVGDTIEGLQDVLAPRQWAEWQGIVAPYRQIPLYLAPGNHDVWSPLSESLYLRFSGHPLHYSFDYGTAHFTILDSSRSDVVPASELAFLEADLKAHTAQPVKFVITHRPSWALNIMMNNPDFAAHQIAKKYGVQFAVAGHIHAMLRADMDGVTYVSVPSSAGNLRATHRYQDGWFYGYSVVEIGPRGITWEVHELAAPHGEGRVTRLAEWGKSGLQ